MDNSSTPDLNKIGSLVPTNQNRKSINLRRRKISWAKKSQLFIQSHRLKNHLYTLLKLHKLQKSVSVEQCTVFHLEISLLLKIHMSNLQKNLTIKRRKRKTRAWTKTFLKFPNHLTYGVGLLLTTRKSDFKIKLNLPILHFSSREKRTHWEQWTSTQDPIHSTKLKTETQLEVSKILRTEQDGRTKLTKT